MKTHSDCWRTDFACEHGTGWIVRGREEEDVLRAGVGYVHLYTDRYTQKAMIILFSISQVTRQGKMGCISGGSRQEESNEGRWASSNSNLGTKVIWRRERAHTPCSSYFDAGRSHPVDFTCEMAPTVRFGSFTWLAYCWYRAKAERRQGERASSDSAGRQLGPASPCEPGLAHTLSDCSEGPFRRATFINLSLSLPPVR